MGFILRNYPKEYYSKEDKLIHKAGYTLALGVMGIGLLETLHSIPYIVKGQSNIVGIALGPSGMVLGGILAGLYLKEAGVVYWWILKLLI